MEQQTTPVIELKNIRQTYDNGRVTIIDQLNLSVPDKPAQGQFIVILGMSGCGKSTLLRYIAGLQKPSAGEVYIHGKPVEQSERVSMVFQQYSSLPWLTVLDNVALALEYKGIPKKERYEKALEMIDMVGLSDHIHKYAQYPALSGGQLQRVAIARSLLANPSILLMDEPFGALDIQTRLQMQDLLSSLWLKFHPTIVFVTHDIAEAVYLGDDIYIMKSPPSTIVRHIPVTLPFYRTREIKKEKVFTDMVQWVEDSMLEVSKIQ
jgi:NitT/TauT family transport system ATP-binding protein